MLSLPIIGWIFLVGGVVLGVCTWFKGGRAVFNAPREDVAQDMFMGHTITFIIATAITCMGLILLGLHYVPIYILK